SRASVSAIAIDVFSMSAAAPRLDAVAADAGFRLQGGQRKTPLPFYRACPKAAHAVLLPVCRLHHLFDSGSLALAQQAEHALPLGDALAPWFFSLRWHLRGGTFLGLRDNRPGRFLGDDRSGRDLAPPWRRGFGAPLCGCGALKVPKIFERKGRHGL